jgi:hypothetical protein
LAVKFNYIITSILITILVAISIKLNLNYFEPLQKLPSPLFGGDYYYQMGVIEHLLRDGGFVDSSSLYDTIPTYLPLYAVIVAKVSLIFNLSVLKAMFYSSVGFSAISIILWFYLLNKLFKTPTISLIGSIYIYSINGLIIKYTEFSIFIMLPIFLLSLFYFMTKRDYKSTVFLAIIYGLASLSHMLFFIGVTLILFMLLIYEIFMHRKDLKSYFQTNLNYILLFIGIALPIVMIYWYRPIFEYHLHSPFNRARLDFPNFSYSEIQLDFIKMIFHTYFTNFNNIYSSLMSLSAIFGVAILAISNNRFVGFCFVSMTIVTFSFFITEPLLDTNFIPSYLDMIFFQFAILLVRLNLLYFIYEKLKSKYNTQILYLYTTLALIIFIYNYKSYSSKNTGTYYNSAKEHHVDDMYKRAGQFIKSKSNINDTIITTKELGFALNSQSGAKLLTGRWAHNGNSHIDLSQRDLDQALILHGSDDKTRVKLLKKYNVKYLFRTDFWIGSEYKYENGKFLYKIDPLIVFDSKENRKILMKNRIIAMGVKDYLDPSSHKKGVDKFDILMITFHNYRNFYSPWNKKLDKYLKKIWVYKDSQERELATIFEVKY